MKTNKRFTDHNEQEQNTAAIHLYLRLNITTGNDLYRCKINSLKMLALPLKLFYEPEPLSWDCSLKEMKNEIQHLQIILIKDNTTSMLTFCHQ